MSLRRNLVVAGGALAALSVMRTLRARPAPPAIPGELRTIDGEVIHYIDRGAGPALIFLSGFGGSAFSWRHALDAFADRYRVIAIDYPGLGYSERDANQPLGLNDHARRIARVMDTLQIERATVVGHSMGGTVALRLAAMFPGKVERLVLMGAPNPAEHTAWERAVRRLRGMEYLGPVLERSPWMVNRAMRVALTQMVHDPECVTQEWIDGYARPLAQRDTGRCLVRLAHCARDEAPLDISQITTPTLVVSGAFDRVIPVTVGRSIAAALPHAEHIVMPNVGHMAPEEAPEHFHEMVEAFLAREASASAKPS